MVRSMFPSLVFLAAARTHAVPRDVAMQLYFQMGTASALALNPLLGTLPEERFAEKSVPLDVVSSG
jgi:hypothetical protein